MIQRSQVKKPNLMRVRVATAICRLPKMVCWLKRHQNLKSTCPHVCVCCFPFAFSFIVVKGTPYSEEATEITIVKVHVTAVPSLRKMRSFLTQVQARANSFLIETHPVTNHEIIVADIGVHG